MTPIEQAKAALGSCRNYFGEHDESIRQQLLFAECSDAIRMLSTIEGSGEPPTYHMSKDYEALYDLLCKGGDAIRTFGEDGRVLGWIGQSTVNNWGAMDKPKFISECQRLNLEWIAPSTPKAATNEQIMDLAVECFELGPEDNDAVLTFMCKLEDLRPEHDQHLSGESTSTK